MDHEEDDLGHDTDVDLKEEGEHDATEEQFAELWAVSYQLYLH